MTKFGVDKKVQVLTARWIDGEWRLYGMQHPKFNVGDDIDYTRAGTTYHGSVLLVELTNLRPGHGTLDRCFVWYRVQPKEIAHHHWVLETEVNLKDT